MTEVFALLSRARYLWISSLLSCGSRTPLLLEPPDASFAGSDAATSDGGFSSNLTACLAGSREVHKVEIDLFFMIDKSRSMRTVDFGQTVSRWDAISSAVAKFIASPRSAGIGAGIGFFPRLGPDGDVLCEPGAYAQPVVPIGLLPGVAASIGKAIGLQTLEFDTPMAPALHGAHAYARLEQTKKPKDAIAVVLVTDGLPRDCGNIATTAAVAEGAASLTPSIKTYVLGVGPTLSNLNLVAQAGGTSQAYLAESGGEAKLLAALEAIRTSALSCEYVFPPGATPRFDLATVTTTIGETGAVTSVDPVPSGEACGEGAGWFYDNPLGQGNAPPTKVTLCPASCAPLTQGEGNHLDVRIGCDDDGG